jgi:ankyrin repeat protein
MSFDQAWPLLLGIFAVLLFVGLGRMWRRTGIQAAADAEAAARQKQAARSEELLKAVRSGDIASAAIFLHSSGPIDAPLRTGITPLGLAVGSVQPSMVAFLLNEGVDANRLGGHGVAPLLYAFGSGYDTYDHLRIVASLLDHGAEINSRHPQYGTTVLHNAIATHHLLALGFLLDRGADPSIQDAMGRTPFFVAVNQACQAEEREAGRGAGSMPCEPGTPRKIVELLIARGAGRLTPNQAGLTPYQFAAGRQCGDTAAMVQGLEM